MCECSTKTDTVWSRSIVKKRSFSTSFVFQVVSNDFVDNNHTTTTATTATTTALCWYGVVKYARRLPARVVNGDWAVWDHLRNAKVFKSVRDAKIKGPLVGTQGHESSPLSRPVVGLNIALHVLPADRASKYLVSFYLPGSFNNFIFPKVHRPRQCCGMCLK